MTDTIQTNKNHANTNPHDQDCNAARPPRRDRTETGHSYCCVLTVPSYLIRPIGLFCTLMWILVSKIWRPNRGVFRLLNQVPMVKSRTVVVSVPETSYNYVETQQPSIGKFQWVRSENRWIRENIVKHTRLLVPCYLIPHNSTSIFIACLTTPSIEEFVRLSRNSVSR